MTTNEKIDDQSSVKAENENEGRIKIQAERKLIQFNYSSNK
jgi:hypothetical protein